MMCGMGLNHVEGEMVFAKTTWVVFANSLSKQMGGKFNQLSQHSLLRCSTLKVEVPCEYP